MNKLREYQQEDKIEIERALSQYRSVLYQLPTGGGKSVVLTSIVSDYKQDNILIFAHKRKLILQLKKHLLSVGIKAGILAGTMQENLESNVMIVSIRTAVKDHRLDALLQTRWDMCIIDEARHSRTSSYDKVLDTLLEKYPSHKLLGVDATPFRKDKKRLDKHFNYMVTSSESVASLTAKGFLQSCKTIVSPLDIQELTSEVKEVANDYQITALSNFMRKDKYLNYVVSQYVQFGEDRPAIAFAVDKSHSKALLSAFECGGYEGRVERIDSDMSEDQIRLAYTRFEGGLSQILINVEMITEGVDLPSAGCIIGARPTKSLTLFMQMVGRGMRLDEINDYFILLDCCGWTQDYGLASAPKTWSLNPEIDPNGGRIGNKIFGKRQDGTLTEDLDLFIGEVVELTPEEYMLLLLGGEQQAAALNVSIDDKINNIIEAVLNKLIDKKVYVDFERKITITETKSGSHVIKFLLEGGDSYWSHGVSLNFDLSAKQIYSSTLRGVDGSKLNQYMKSAILNGQLSEKLIDNPKYIQFAFETLAQIDDLLKSKINMGTFEKVKLEQKQKEREDLIAENVKGGNVFLLENHIIYSNHFKQTDYSTKKIESIAIKGSKLTFNNTLIITYKMRNRIYNEQTRNYENQEELVSEEKNYVKKEKLYELLEIGQWNIKK